MPSIVHDISFFAVAALATAATTVLTVENTAGAETSPHCMTRVLADVPAEEAPEQVKSKSNGDFGPVTKIKVSKKTGRMLFCAENSYCYNSNAFELVTPCRLKLDKEGGFGDYYFYFTR